MKIVLFDNVSIEFLKQTDFPIPPPCNWRPWTSWETVLPFEQTNQEEAVISHVEMPPANGPPLPRLVSSSDPDIKSITIKTGRQAAAVESIAAAIADHVSVNISFKYLILFAKIRCFRIKLSRFYCFKQKNSQKKHRKRDRDNEMDMVPDADPKKFMEFVIIFAINRSKSVKSMRIYDCSMIFWLNI